MQVRKWDSKLITRLVHDPLGHSTKFLVHRPRLFFHDSIYEDYAVICVNFRGGNDSCVVLKSETELYAFADL